VQTNFLTGNPVWPSVRRLTARAPNRMVRCSIWKSRWQASITNFAVTGDVVGAGGEVDDVALRQCPGLGLQGPVYILRALGQIDELVALDRIFQTMAFSALTT
jgi:hypothetical protein